MHCTTRRDRIHQGGLRWPVASVLSQLLARVLAALTLCAGIAATACGQADDPLVMGHAALFGSAGTGHQQGLFTGNVNLNEFLGADRFYAAGFTGTNAMIANIEAGHAWSGHEALGHVQQIPAGSGAVLAEFDRHATWVAAVMGGRPAVLDPGDHQMGIAPDAALYSGAIATNWSGGRFTTGFFFSFNNSTFGPYRAAFQDGLGGLRPADVINSSWNASGVGSDTGTNLLSGVLDALANENPYTLMTVSAGNSLPTGAGPNRVLSPATAYNNLSVAALGPADLGYNEASFFSNGGPNNYSDPVTGTLLAVRQAVDIAAPGENIATAYYGGQTGGNRFELGGAADGPAGGADWYSRSVRGTSFSAPLVAGGAGLLYDAAYTVFPNNTHARDARVVKAVLMNSADKTAGWNNGQVPHPNGFGGVLTTQGLDSRVGTGRMNLHRAFDQYLSGTTDINGMARGGMGAVETVGWDFGMVSEEMTNDYLIGPQLDHGLLMNATLTWFRDRAQVGTSSFREQSYDNLDLEFWSVEDGVPLAIISASNSIYNNTEHLSFTIPSTGHYMLRVRWTSELFDMAADANTEAYGLAWAVIGVPEPGSVALVLVALVCVMAGRRR